MAFSRMVQVRVPGEIQDVANAVIQASGLTVSDVVCLFMTRIAQDKSIPAVLLEPNAVNDSQPAPGNIAADSEDWFARAERDTKLESGKITDEDLQYIISEFDQIKSLELAPPVHYPACPAACSGRISELKHGFPNLVTLSYWARYPAVLRCATGLL